MPAIPSGSYLAEGFGTTSTRSITFGRQALEVGTELRAGDRRGRPLICTATFSLPRRLTLPSASTVTDGVASSTSLALAAAGATSLARYELRSGSIVTASCFSTTSTWPRARRRRA